MIEEKMSAIDQRIASLERGTMPVKLMNVSQVADFLQVSPSTVYRLVAIDDLPMVRVGSLLRIDRHMLVKWFNTKYKHYAE